MGAPLPRGSRQSARRASSVQVGCVQRCFQVRALSLIRSPSSLEMHSVPLPFGTALSSCVGAHPLPPLVWEFIFMSDAPAFRSGPDDCRSQEHPHCAAHPHPRCAVKCRVSTRGRMAWTLSHTARPPHTQASRMSKSCTSAQSTSARMWVRRCAVAGGNTSMCLCVSSPNPVHCPFFPHAVLCVYWRAVGSGRTSGNASRNVRRKHG